MAVYRHIHIDFWQDGFVLDLTPEEKYFYMYLMTNSKTSQCGIYELPKRIIETETGYNRETVEKLISRFKEYKKIIYCEETKEIFLLNWMKHNKANSPQVKKCIEKELNKIKNKEFIGVFLEVCKEIKYSIDTLSIDYGEKEKEKQKEKEEKKEKQKYKEKDENEKINLSMYIKNNIIQYAKLYEENIGLINGIASEWLIEVSENVDIRLFKKALEIATCNSCCNQGYVNGILKQWRSNNIRNLEDLNAYKLNKDKKGVANHDKYQRAVDEEEQEFYRKPTEKELKEFKKFLEENTKL
ncbi:DnaD domain protein [Paraclostridium sordellii]